MHGRSCPLRAVNRIVSGYIMITFDKNYWFFYGIICFLCIFNTSLIFSIPLVLQVSGLITLCFLPGFLLCLLFGIHVSDGYENILYAIGVSIITDLLFGLLLNVLLPILGGDHPLSTQNLQIGFSVLILVLTILAFVTQKTPKVSLQLPQLTKPEKIYLISGLGIVICSLLGNYLLNANVSNILLMVSLFLIPVLLVSLIISYPAVPRRLYPVLIFFISFALVMILALKSNYILGDDVHSEFYFFQLTITNSLWVPDPQLLLSSAISISLLPAVFEKILLIDPQLLFKILYPLISSLTPVIVYQIVRKYFDEILAIFGSCFYIFQLIFINTTSNSRTSLIYFFFALVVLVLCDKELSHFKKYILLLLFIAGAVLSHYTSALFFFVILVFAFFMNLALNKVFRNTERGVVRLPLIIFFSILIYFWYEQIHDIFNIGYKFLSFRINILFDLFNSDVSKYHTYYSDSLVSLYSPSQRFINIYPRYFCFAFMGIGILYACYLLFRTIRKRDGTHQAIAAGTNPTILFMGLMAFFLLTLSVFASFLFFGYDTGRLSELLFVVLSVFLVAGVYWFFTIVVSLLEVSFSKRGSSQKGEPLIRYARTHQNKIVALILFVLIVPQLFSSTQVINQLYGGPYALTLNHPEFTSPYYDDPGRLYFIYDQDALALQWFNDNSEKNSFIHSDYYGNAKIISQINRRSTLYQNNIFESGEEENLNTAVFLAYLNVNLGKFYSVPQPMSKTQSINNILDGKNKIFENGAIIYQ